MSDPLRDAPPLAPEDGDADRNTKIEQLLLVGLDHYFSAQYEQAIHVWTRVLFLDRGHARARAYIERARGAIAERHRELEEQLHSGVAAFNRGDTDEARRLLLSAVARGGPHEIALTYLERLDRLKGAGGTGESIASRTKGTASTRSPGRSGAFDPPRRRLFLPALLLAVIASAAVYVMQSWDALQNVMVRQESAVMTAVPAHTDELPVPTGSELALARARTLFERGRLRDSLRALDAVQLGDPVKADADVLRARIQRVLLAPADARDPGAARQ